MPYRLTHPITRRGFYVLLLAGMVASFVALGVVLVGRFDASTAACEQVNELRVAITASLQRSEATLPTLSYYRHHLTELARAERQVAQELAQFHPVRC